MARPAVANMQTWYGVGTRPWAVAHTARCAQTVMALQRNKVVITLREEVAGPHSLTHGAHQVLLVEEEA